MKILKIHLIEAAVAALFFILVFAFYPGRGEDAVRDISYNQGWTVIANGEVREYDTLPEAVSLQEGEEELIIRKELPGDLHLAETIGYYTSHQLTEVYVDDEKIYERKVPEGSKSKTPGNCWNFVRIWEKYAGKTLEIHIRNCYDSFNIKIPALYYGEQSEIILGQIRSRFLSLAICFIMFTMGMVLVAIWFAIGKKMYFHRGVPWLGLFSVYFAVWSAVETKIPMLMFGRPLLFSQMTFISLKLMLFPFIYFIRTINRKGKRLLDIVALFCVLDFAFSFLAQVVGWFDLRETIWITHLIGVGGALTVLVLGARMLYMRKPGEKKRDRRFWVNVSCVCIISACVLMDATNYYLGLYSDVAFFSRIACMIYIFVLSKQFLEESLKLIQVGRHAEEILEEAELDGITSLKNRRSFEADLHKISKVKYPQYSVVMFDLNNLKMVNDCYGHGMGDGYIINGSEIIRDEFGDMGEIYRIGGDEFCLVSDVLTEEVFEEKKKEMCEWLESLQGTPIKDIMQIASGFAKYSRSKDLNLQDTIGRADERMYRCKRRQKAMKHNIETA